MNFADSDEMNRHFKERGFSKAATEDEADAVLVNTCTVRDMAEHKAASYIGRLKDWKKDHAGRFIVVTGCAAERAKQEFKKKFPFIDLVVGAKDIETFPAELDNILNSKFEQFDDLVPNQMSVPETSPVSQYVTIMRGCNYNCSYCIVPSVRGREVYIPIQKILSDARDRVKEGAKEIWLLGQTVNSYKPTVAPRSDYDFSDLLKDVNEIDGLERIRFISPHPYYLTPKLIEAMAVSQKVCEHIHLPVQSGSTRLLGAMKRNYTRDGYLRGIENIRKAIPHISITTDIIVGFPGESQKDFEDTLSLIDEARFDSAYCFKYSPRPGTVSAQMEDDVSLEEKEKRLNILLEKTERLGAEKAKALVGTAQEALIEDDKGEGIFRGKTRQSWRVRIKNPALKLGQLVKIRITNHHSRELHADLI